MFSRRNVDDVDAKPAGVREGDLNQLYCSDPPLEDSLEAASLSWLVQTVAGTLGRHRGPGHRTADDTGGDPYPAQANPGGEAPQSPKVLNTKSQVTRPQTHRRGNHIHKLEE